MSGMMPIPILIARVIQVSVAGCTFYHAEKSASRWLMTCGVASPGAASSCATISGEVQGRSRTRGPSVGTARSRSISDRKARNVAVFGKCRSFGLKLGAATATEVSELGNVRLAVSGHAPIYFGLHAWSASRRRPNFTARASKSRCPRARRETCPIALFSRASLISGQVGRLVMPAARQLLLTRD